jgi:hypothetical protein
MFPLIETVYVTTTVASHWPMGVSSLFTPNILQNHSGGARKKDMEHEFVVV